MAGILGKFWMLGDEAEKLWPLWVIAAKCDVLKAVKVVVKAGPKDVEKQT